MEDDHGAPVGRAGPKWIDGPCADQLQSGPRAIDEFVVYTPLALARCLGRVATLRSLYYREGITQGASQKGTS